MAARRKTTRRPEDGLGVHLMRATIKQVAAAAGVSPATVSNVLNKTRFVSPELCDRVHKAMSDLNYEPNALARSLRNQRTCTIGVIVPDISNPFYGTLSTAIEAKAREAGYTVMVCITHYDLQLEYAEIKTLVSKQVDGIIIAFSADNLTAVRYAHGHHVPVIVVDWFVNDAWYDVVTADNRQGGYLAARHLLGLGHRDVAYVTGRLDGMPSSERLAGFLTAMSDAGIRTPKSWIIHYPKFDFSEARATVRRLLDSRKPPTAVCFGNDYMALGALSALHEAGLRVPDDISIVGFDDIWVSSLSNPTLTTVRQPTTRLGEEAFAILLTNMVQGGMIQGQKVTLGVELVKRDSSGPPPAYTPRR